MSANNDFNLSFLDVWEYGNAGNYVLIDACIRPLSNEQKEKYLNIYLDFLKNNTEDQIKIKRIKESACLVKGAPLPVVARLATPKQSASWRDWLPSFSSFTSISNVSSVSDFDQYQYAPSTNQSPTDKIDALFKQIQEFNPAFSTTISSSDQNSSSINKNDVEMNSPSNNKQEVSNKKESKPQVVAGGDYLSQLPNEILRQILKNTDKKSVDAFACTSTHNATLVGTAAANNESSLRSHIMKDLQTNDTTKVLKLLSLSEENPTVIIKHAQDLGYLNNDVEGAITYIAQLMETVEAIRDHYAMIYETRYRNSETLEVHYTEALENINQFKNLFKYNDLDTVLQRLEGLSLDQRSKIPHLATFIQSFFLVKANDRRHISASLGVCHDKVEQQPKLVEFVLNLLLYPAIKAKNKELVLQLVKHGIHPNWGLLQGQTIKIPSEIKEFIKKEAPLFKKILELRREEIDNLIKWSAFEAWEKENLMNWQ